jgi:GntP family gluconate:H+ symporter
MLNFVILLISIFLIILTTTRWKWHPFLALLFVTLFYGIGTGIPMETIISTMNDGFGSTIGSIGIIIIAGLIIGTFLEKSGGAKTLAHFILRIIGEKRIHWAMGMIGYVVSIPVFVDSGFIILSPLNKALTKKAGISLAGTATALSMGLLCTHTMVPPTPGPIAAAAIIGADLGEVILIGLITSLGALVVTILFAKYMGSKILIEPQVEEAVVEVEKEDVPSITKSFLPIVVPILLIVFRSIAEYPTAPFGDGQIVDFIKFLGNPVVALSIGMLLSFMLPKKFDRSMLGTSGWVGDALKSGAIIILITGAGGAFGKMIQASDINSIIETHASSLNIGLFLPFVLAAVIKTAQGSSTVAIITTASIIMPMLASLGLDDTSSRALVVVAIGAGASLVSHANDSYFWVVTQMTGMKVSEGYKLHSMGTVVLGVSAMAVLFLIKLIAY